MSLIVRPHQRRGRRASGHGLQVPQLRHRRATRQPLGPILLSVPLTARHEMLSDFLDAHGDGVETRAGGAVHPDRLRGAVTGEKRIIGQATDRGRKGYHTPGTG